MGSDEEKIGYVLGVNVAMRNLGELKGLLEVSELEAAVQGMSDALLDKEMKVELTPEWGTKINALVNGRAAKKAEESKAAGAAFLAKAAEEPGAVKTDSGLVIQELVAGTGKSPAATDQVNVHYHGTLIDGKFFDSSVDRGQPINFPLNGVIPGWTEGLQLMKEGGKSKLVIPSELAYGENVQGDIPPGATLVFEVELLQVL